MIESCDAVIAIGGDGTIIHAAKHAAHADKPILGVNVGRLGFVAGLEVDELELLEHLVTGQYTEEKRMMISVKTFFQGRPMEYQVLNDAVMPAVLFLEFWIFRSLSIKALSAIIGPMG